MKNHRKKKLQPPADQGTPTPYTERLGKPRFHLSDPIGFPNWSLLNFGKNTEGMAPSAARLQKVLSPEGSELSQFLREAQGAPSSQRQRSEPCYGTQVLNVKRLVHHHPGARIVVQILLTRPATVLSSFFGFSMFHENIYIVISSFFHQNTTEFPINLPNRRRFSEVYPTKKNTPKNGGTSSSSRASPHCADEVGVFIYPSESFSQMLHLKMAPKKTRRFLRNLQIKKLSGSIRSKLGDLWCHDHSRLIFAEVKVVWLQAFFYGLELMGFWFKSLFFKIDNKFFFFLKKKTKKEATSRWWLNQPIWKMCGSQIGDHETPIFGVKIQKKNWNRHHLGIYESMNLVKLFDQSPNFVAPTISPPSPFCSLFLFGRNLGYFAAKLICSPSGVNSHFQAFHLRAIQKFGKKQKFHVIFTLVLIFDE